MILKWISNLECQILVFILLWKKSQAQTIQKKRESFPSAFLKSPKYVSAPVTEMKQSTDCCLDNLSKFLVCNASIAFQWREKELLYSYNHLKELSPHFQRFLTSHYRSTDISSILQAVSGVIWIAMIHNFSHRLFDKVKWKTNLSLVPLDLLLSRRKHQKELSLPRGTTRCH